MVGVHCSVSWKSPLTDISGPIRHHGRLPDLTIGALQAFSFDAPNELISARFPLVMVPVFAVPLAVILHVVSLIKLRRDAPRSFAVAAT